MSAVQSEYTSKYVWKADSTKINAKFLTTAAIMARREKTETQKASAILSKMLNALHGSMTYSSVLVAVYLLTGRDAWFPRKTQPLDWHAHQQCLLKMVRKVLVTAAGDGVDAEQEHTILADDDQTLVVGPTYAYRHRNNLLDSWSPYELTAAFEFGKARTLGAKALCLTVEGGATGHNPRGEPALPQLFRECPTRPEATASADDKEAWAAFALGTFFPYDSMLCDLAGDTLWEKAMDWEERKPRGTMDVIAWSCLNNIQIRCLARIHMREDAKVNQARRAELRRAGGDACYGHEHAGDATEVCHRMLFFCVYKSSLHVSMLCTLPQCIPNASGFATCVHLVYGPCVLSLIHISHICVPA